MRARYERLPVAFALNQGDLLRVAQSSSFVGIWIRRVAVLVVAAFGLIAFTGWALEAGGVAIVETERADGTTRSTHVWFVEPAGGSRQQLWLEAGTPENGWYLDILARPTLSLESDPASDLSGVYLAEPIPGRAAHEEIRRMLRAKYGIRDWWIATLFDTSRSIAVRLIPLPANQELNSTSR